MSDVILPVKKSSTNNVRVQFVKLSALLCLALLSVSAHAAVLSWSGGGGANANWNNIANWGGAGIPANGDTLIFFGPQPNLLNTNNIAGLTLNQIRFQGASGGFDLRGNSFTLTNNIECTNSAGANTIENNITLATKDQIVDVTVSLTLSGVLSGSVGVIKNGAGTLLINGAFSNIYGGTTTVNAGLVQLAKNGFPAATAIPGNLIIGDGSSSATVQNMTVLEIADTADLTINNNGTYNLNNNSEAIGNNLTLNGNGSVTTGAGTLTLSPNATIAANPGFLTSCSVSGNFNVGSGVCIFNVSGGFLIGSLLISANMGGTATTITKTGGGFMSLSGANSFSGQMNVANGTLGVANPLALGTTAGGTTVSNTATLQISTSVTNEPLTIASTGVGLINASGANTWVSNIVLAAATTFEIDGVSLDIQGLITGSGGFTKTGAGTLRLSGSGDNTYTGATTVNVGILELNQSSGHSIDDSSSLTIGDGAGGSDVDIVRYINANGNQIFIAIPITINSSGLLDLNGHSDDIGPIIFSGGGDIQTSSGILSLSGGMSVINASNTATINGKIQMSGNTITVDDGSAFYDLQIPASVSGSGFNIVNGANSNAFVLLQGSNSFTGPLTISGLTTDVETPWSLGTTNGTTTLMNGGELFVYSTEITNETVVLNAGTILTAQYDVIWNGPIILNGNATIHGFTTPGLFDITGPISGTGNLTSTAATTNRFSGSQANTYNGTTTVTDGTLVLNKTATDGAIPGDLVITSSSIVRLARSEQINDSSDVLINSGSLFGTGAFFELIDTLRGRGTVNFGVGGWIEVGLNNGSSTFAGVMSGTGYTFGGYSVAKRGGGIFTMNGDNTFTAGAYHVFDGNMVMNGSSPQVPVIVDNGAGFAGIGTVGTIACSGVLVPGPLSGIGTLTSSNVAFTSSALFGIYLTGPNPGTDYNQLNVRGTNALANAFLDISFGFTKPVAIGQQFVILNNDAAEPITGIFGGYPEGFTINIVNGFSGTISYAGGSGNDVVITLTDVPGAELAATVTSGNGSHTIDPNECNNLNVVITNKSGVAITGNNATLSTTTPGVIITQPYSAYPNIPAGGKGTNTTAFQISTLPSFTCGNDIDLQLSVASSGGSSFITSFTLHTGAPAAPVRFDNNTLLNIPDVSIVESTNNVASWSGGPIQKVGVSLWLGAPVDSVVNLTLFAPDGTSVDLSSGNGGLNPNYGTGNADGSRTTFDDAAGINITAGAAPFVGTFSPESPLAAMIGTSPVGPWRLRIQDTGFSGNPDTLFAWSLFLYGTACSSGGGACDYCLSSFTGSITNTDLTQTGRVTRNGVVASCGAPKSWPGFFDTSARNYDIYAFTNTSASDACVTVILTASCDVQACIYLNAFNPANITNNYIGDAGTSTSGGSTTCSATVPAGGKFFVTVDEVDPGTGCSSYTLQLSGLPCPPPRLFIDPLIPAPAVRLHWSTSAGGYKLEGTPSLAPANWSFVTNEPIATGNQYRVTNSAPPVDRFYRLNKP